MPAETATRYSTRLKRRRDSCHEKTVFYPRKRRKYSYDSLDKTRRQIRLFELLPGNKDAPLHGRLTTVFLEEFPQYDAVSYVWGDSTPCFSLIVDDGVLMVAKNVQKALTALRLETESRILWMDAISINQEDLQERGHQVGLMKAIYSSAQCVRIWLDVEVDLNSPAFRAVQRLKAPQVDWLFRDNSVRCELRGSKYLKDYNVEFWAPLFKILENAHWERAWTQQELFLARNIQLHFSNGVLSPETLIRFDDAVLPANGWLPRVVSRPLVASVNYQSRMFGRSLFSSMYQGFCAVRLALEPSNFNAPILCNLFLKATHLKATDSKDMVYGMLGLARDFDEDDIEPDYTLARDEVYALAIKHFIRKHGSLDFLCNFANSHDHRLPSWLPSPEKDATLLMDHLAISNVAKQRHGLHSFKLDEKVLSIRGIKCDKITAKVSGFTNSTPIVMWWKQLENMCVKLGLCQSPAQTSAGKVLLEVLSFYITEDSFRQFFNKPKLTSKELKQGILLLIQLPKRTGLAGLTLGHTVDRMPLQVREQSWRILQTLRLTMSRSTFIGTRERRFGLSFVSCALCPANPGDEVWFLFGCPMPMILRPNGERLYKVIGPAVIPGLMNGEACEGILPDGTPGPEYKGPKDCICHSR